MAKTKLTRTIAATLLGTAVLGAPITSYAQDFRSVSQSYNDCRVENRNNQIAGGLFGALAGGILGSEISGRRARTGSTIAGASLGAITGSALAGTARNCNTQRAANTVYSTPQTVYNTPQTVYTSPAQNTVYAAPPTQTYSGQAYSGRAYSGQTYGTNNNGGFRQASLGHNDYKIEARLKQIERELYKADVKLERLHYERDTLLRRSKFSHSQRGVKRELRNINKEIKIYENCKYDLEREANRLQQSLYY